MFVIYVFTISKGGVLQLGSKSDQADPGSNSDQLANGVPQLRSKLILDQSRISCSITVVDPSLIRVGEHQPRHTGTGRVFRLLKLTISYRYRKSRVSATGITIDYRHRYR